MDCWFRPFISQVVQLWSAPQEITQSGNFSRKRANNSLPVWQVTGNRCINTIQLRPYKIISNLSRSSAGGITNLTLRMERLLNNNSCVFQDPVVTILLAHLAKIIFRISDHFHSFLGPDQQRHYVVVATFGNFCITVRQSKNIFHNFCGELGRLVGVVFTCSRWSRANQFESHFLWQQVQDIRSIVFS